MTVPKKNVAAAPKSSAKPDQTDPVSSMSGAPDQAGELPEEPVVLWYPKPGGGMQIPVISAEHYQRLRTIAARAVEDARRYRWLREHSMAISCSDDDTDAGNFRYELGDDGEGHPDILDAAIDAALNSGGGIKRSLPRKGEPA